MWKWQSQLPSGKRYSIQDNSLLSKRGDRSRRRCQPNRPTPACELGMVEKSLTERAQSPCSDASGKTDQATAAVECIPDFISPPCHPARMTTARNGQSRLLLFLPASPHGGPNDGSHRARAIALRTQIRRGAGYSLSFYWYVALFPYICIMMRSRGWMTDIIGLLGCRSRVDPRYFVSSTGSIYI